MAETYLRALERAWSPEGKLSASPVLTAVDELEREMVLEDGWAEWWRVPKAQQMSAET
jgi:hypothetical protein